MTWANEIWRELRDKKEKDERDKNRIMERAKKIYDVIQEFGLTQNVCSKIDSCNYVLNQMRYDRTNNNPSIQSFSEAHGHITLICEKYPLACKLNLEELKLRRLQT